MVVTETALTDQEEVELLQLLQAEYEQKKRDDLGFFIQELSGDGSEDPYSVPEHLRALMEAFEAVARGETRFVVCSTPPRFGKTMTLLAAMLWLLVRNPRLRLCYVTAKIDLARLMGLRARAMAQRAGIELDPSREVMADWRTREGGEFVATSVESPPTGRGFHLFVVDDPIKASEEAESELQRTKANTYFGPNIFSRRHPGGSCVVNMARWHEDDIAGRLAAQTFPKWQVINLPALSDDGQSLWPQRWPVSELQMIRAQVGEYGWNALYQGRPSSPSGGIFKRAWMNNRYNGWPAQITNIIQSVDSAWKEGPGSDYSVIATWGASVDKYYLLEIWRARVEYPELQRAVLDHAAHYKPNALLIEDSASGKAVIQSLQRATRLPIIPIKATASKESRASAVAPLFEAGKVYLPESAPWTGEYVEELANFPGGRHDDMVDCTSMALSRLAGIEAGQVLDLTRKQQTASFRGSVFGR